MPNGQGLKQVIKKCWYKIKPIQSIFDCILKAPKIEIYFIDINKLRDNEILLSFSFIMHQLWSN